MKPQRRRGFWIRNAQLRVQLEVVQENACSRVADTVLDRVRAGTAHRFYVLPYEWP